ncbi:MAG: hypothetical protein LH470_04895 [Lysobacter sp.]|nr:hypothetical protein [Lysobacter sp.]
MLGKLTCGLALALLLAPFAAQAQTTHVDIQQRMTAEQRQATGLDTLSPAQLELLNRLLREETEKTVIAVKAEASRATASTSNENDTPRRPSYIGLDDKPIASRLKGSINGWEPGTVFELENGQQWKVLKGSMKLRKPLQVPEIVVVPGVAGRWFLQVDEDMPKARVYRID